QHHLECLSRSGLADVRVMTDLDAAAVAAAAPCAPGARIVGSLEELLREELDGVVIATPSAQHAEQCLAALERGLAVFCQRPLARNAAETARVVCAARRADRLLAADCSYRFTAAMQGIQDLVRSGGLGHVYAAHLVFHNAYGPDKPWFYDPRLSGGGCLMDLGIHLVDLAYWVFGGPALASASCRLFAGGRPLQGRHLEVEDFAVGRLDFAGGATAQIECSWRPAPGPGAGLPAPVYRPQGGAGPR